MTDQLVSIILPAYRAAPTIVETIARIQHATIDIETEIIVVDDGSDDGTAHAARQADADHVVELKENRGKGAAVRAGVSIASGTYVLFTDVDLAYEPSQILKLIEALNAGADVVLGSRRHLASREVNSPGVAREWGSRVFNRLTRIVVPSPHLDTQCGLKGFTSEAAQTIFSQAKVDGFAFDVEVLFLARKLGCVITEIPVILDHVEQSTVKFIPQAIRMFWDVIRVRVWSNLGRYSDLPPRHG
jgi:dolichyl-phosphate beta-glucosyltransferase